MFRKRETRSFRPDFLIHMAPYGGLPPIESMRLWARPRRLRIFRNGVYSHIRSGDATRVTHLRIIVKYLMDPSNRMLDEWRGLADFLRRHGLVNPELADEETVFDLVTAEGDPSDEGMVPEVFPWVFQRIVNPIQYVRPIRHTELTEAKEAIGWVCIDSGRQLAGNPDLPIFEALDRSRERMGLTVKEYQDRILGLWARNEWMIVRAVNGNETKGVAINLPVTESYYYSLRSGKGWSYDCDPNEIEPHASQYLVVEALANNAMEHSRKRKPGFAMIMAILCQQARLSDVGGCPESKPLHLLTFTATPVGTARAKRFGYKPIDSKMGGSDLQFLERTLHLEGAGMVDAQIIGVWQGIQKELRRAYPRPSVVVVPGGGLPVTC